jgi:hypothetical protein
MMIKTLPATVIAALLLAACQSKPQPAATAEKPKGEAAATSTPAKAAVTPEKVADDKPKVVTTVVQFPKGETGAEYEKTIAPGETHIYVVNVRQGQYFGAQTYSDEDTPFTVRRKGGAELEAPEGSVKWGGDAPQDGDYEIVVKGAKKATKYTISINAE